VESEQGFAAKANREMIEQKRIRKLRRGGRKDKKKPTGEKYPGSKYTRK